jgi:hypothetical protein
VTSPYSTGRRGVQYGSNPGAVGRAKSIKGAEDLLALSKRLKAAGQTELRKELHKDMREAAKPLIPKVRKAAREQLPSAGGLNERIAKKPYRSQVRTGARTAGVRITGSKVDPRINQGRVWHPVFGREGKAKNGGRNSVVQNVPSADGYFDDTLRDQGPAVREELRQVLDAWVQRTFR